METNINKRALVWFSCGASSTVALFYALKEYDEVVALYCDTGGEHEDNLRYLKDVEKLLGIKIVILKSDKYQNHFDVFEKQKYLGYMNFAPCTLQLKKKVRQEWEALVKREDCDRVCLRATRSNHHA